MTSRRASFGDLLEPGLRKIMFDEYKAIPQAYTKVFNVLSSTKQDETDSGISGFGQFDNQTESGTLTYEDPIQGYDVSYTHQKFSKGFKVTEELWDDDQYNKIKKMPAKLGVSANRTVETQAADILNNAFVTTYTTGGDGYALCSASHPRSDGGTAQSNTGTAVLSEAAIKAAELAMEQVLDDKGQLIQIMPNLLIVPPALKHTAKILLQSTGRPYDGTTIYDKDANTLKGEYELMVWAYLSNVTTNGSDTAWFLMDTSIAELNFFWRKQLTFGQDESFDTDEALYKAKMRFSCGFSNWRGFWGSTGLG